MKPWQGLYSRRTRNSSLGKLPRSSAVRSIIDDAIFDDPPSPPSNFIIAWAEFEDNGMILRTNVAGQSVGCQMNSATDGSAFTGSVNVFVTVDGGTQASGGGTVAHEGNGYHSYAPTQAETNGVRLAYTFVASGAIPRTVHATGVSFNPADATALGLSRLDASVSSRSSHAAADVWSVATRLLTAGTNIVLAKGTGITGFNDLSAAQVNTEVDTALSDVGLTSTITGRIDASMSSRASQASVDTVDTNVDSILDDTGTSGVIVATNNDKTGYAIGTGGIGSGAFASGAITAASLNSDAVDEILDEQIGDGTITARQALKLLVAALGGKVSGAGTSTITIRNYADTTDVVVASVDGSGNRSSTTVTL